MTNRYGNTLAVKEHLLENKPITRLEAIIMYGVSNLPETIQSFKKGRVYYSKRKIPYLVALRRLNQICKVTPPRELPIQEIFLTEYWINKKLKGKNMTIKLRPWQKEVIQKSLDWYF